MQVGQVDLRQAASGLREIHDTGDQAVLADQQIGRWKSPWTKPRRRSARDRIETWSGRRRARRRLGWLPPGRLSSACTRSSSGIGAPASAAAASLLEHRDGLAEAAGEAVALAGR